MFDQIIHLLEQRSPKMMFSVDLCAKLHCTMQQLIECIEKNDHYNYVIKPIAGLPFQSEFGFIPSQYVGYKLK